MKAQFLACGKRNKKTQRQTIATCCHRCKTGLCVTQARRLFTCRRCGSCSVFEVAHSVYKYAPNSFSFGRNPKTLSLRADLLGVAISWKRNDKLFLRPCHNYSLFIINFNAVAAMTAFVHYLNVKIFRISSKIACGDDEKHS